MAEEMKGEGTKTVTAPFFYHHIGIHPFLHLVPSWLLGSMGRVGGSSRSRSMGPQEAPTLLYPGSGINLAPLTVGKVQQ